MKPYSRNNINYDIMTPVYAKNDLVDRESRYSIYRKIINLDFPVLEIKLTNSISQNPTYRGYYYTTTQNETVYQIAKKYYQNEQYYWIICKANNLKNEGSTIIEKGVTLSIPMFAELNNDGGYFTMI